MRAFDRTDTSVLANWWWTVDRPLLMTLAGVAAIGVVFIFTASPPVAERVGLSSWHFALRQCLFLGLAALVLAAVSMLAPLGVRRIGVGLFWVGLALLALVPLIGHEVNGATRWITVAGLRLQPSEFVKPALVVVAAHALAARDGLGGVPRAALPVALVTALMLVQPDVGQALLVLAVFAVMVFAAGLAWPWVAVFAGGGAATAVMAYHGFDHVRARVDAFLSADPGFQVQQSLMAVEAGGWLGRGPGEGVVKNHLPDGHADFIFAAGIEEFGLVVGLLLVVLFAMVVLRGLVLAERQPDRFAQLGAVGLLTQFGLQAGINLGVNVAILPPKGMTLPFVSYGGSSLIALALGTGMALALLRKTPALVVVR